MITLLAYWVTDVSLTLLLENGTAILTAQNTFTLRMSPGIADYDGVPIFDAFEACWVENGLTKCKYEFYIDDFDIYKAKVTQASYLQLTGLKDEIYFSRYSLDYYGPYVCAYKVVSAENGYYGWFAIYVDIKQCSYDLLKYEVTVVKPHLGFRLPLYIYRGVKDVDAYHPQWVIFCNDSGVDRANCEKFLGERYNDETVMELALVVDDIVVQYHIPMDNRHHMAKYPPLIQKANAELNINIAMQVSDYHIYVFIPQFIRDYLPYRTHFVQFTFILYKIGRWKKDAELVFNFSAAEVANKHILIIPINRSTDYKLQNQSDDNIVVIQYYGEDNLLARDDFVYTFVPRRNSRLTLNKDAFYHVRRRDNENNPILVFFNKDEMINCTHLGVQYDNYLATHRFGNFTLSHSMLTSQFKAAVFMIDQDGEYALIDVVDMESYNASDTIYTACVGFLFVALVLGVLLVVLGNR